jgi:hypothetical protein
MPHNFMHYSEDGDAFVTAFLPGYGKPLTASTASHPNFAEIVQALKSDAPVDDLVDLFDIERAVARRFENLSERVTVANGRVYFDGDEVDNSLSRQIVRFIEEGVEDWQSLVNFMENVAANPNQHSREQLYEWLKRRDFTITPEGYLIGYKGVKTDLKSVNSGPGIVNGEEVNGHLDNSPGNTVEIARSLVHHDPGVGCSRGLHVGTYDYASRWGAVCLKVEVNPRDVVSVPTDCDAAKVRVCRYHVIDVIEKPLTNAVYNPAFGDEDEWDDDLGFEDEAF